MILLSLIFSDYSLPELRVIVLIPAFLLLKVKSKKVHALSR